MIAWLQTWAGLCVDAVHVRYERFDICHAPSLRILFVNFALSAATVSICAPNHGASIYRSTDHITQSKTTFEASCTLAGRPMSTALHQIASSHDRPLGPVLTQVIVVKVVRCSSATWHTHRCVFLSHSFNCACQSILQCSFDQPSSPDRLIQDTPCET